MQKSKRSPSSCVQHRHPELRLLLSQILLLPCFSLSLLHVFSSLLSWGITGCSGALQCGAEQGGGSGGEGEEGIIGIEWSLMLIPCTQTILWLFWLIPGPGPSRYSSPTVAGISPDKQLKEL